jgi:hypothetical protein
MPFGRRAMGRYPVALADPIEEGHRRILDHRGGVVCARRRFTCSGCPGSGYRNAVRRRCVCVCGGARPPWDPAYSGAGQRIRRLRRVRPVAGEYRRRHRRRTAERPLASSVRRHATRSHTARESLQIRTHDAARAAARRAVGSASHAMGAHVAPASARGRLVHSSISGSNGVKATAVQPDEGATDKLLRAHPLRGGVAKPGVSRARDGPATSIGSRADGTDAG